MKSATDNIFNNKGVTIWDEQSDVKGVVGPIYGKHWHNRKGDNLVFHDQIHEFIQRIRTNPDSRRLIVSAWNVADVASMALAPYYDTSPSV